MRYLKFSAVLLLAVSALGLGGCNDGFCDYNSCNADPSGIYEGFATDSVSHATTSVVVIIGENGDGTLSGQDGSYYRLSVTTSGNNLGGSYQGDVSGSTTTTTGTISGGLTNNGLALDLNGASNHVVAVTLNYDNVYGLSSSLPTLQGSWTTTTASYNGIICASGSSNCPPATASTLNLNIQNAGSFTGTDSNGCTYSGSFSLIYPPLNAYGESFTRTCSGQPAHNFTGLATYFPASGSGTNAVPARILLMADDGSGGNYVSALLQ